MCNHFMSSQQIEGQLSEEKEFNIRREYNCPDCGAQMYFMGTDFKAPKRTNKKAWEEAERFIKSGNVYYRGSQDK